MLVPLDVTWNYSQNTAYYKWGNRQRVKWLVKNSNSDFPFASIIIFRKEAHYKFLWSHIDFALHVDSSFWKVILGWQSTLGWVWILFFLLAIAVSQMVLFIFSEASLSFYSNVNLCHVLHCFCRKGIFKMEFKRHPCLL